MPSAIVPDSSPPPCDLTVHDIEALSDQLAAYHAHFAPAFARTTQAVWAEHYVRGLLSPCTRKAIEPIALHFGLPIRPLQHFIGQSRWPTAPLIAEHQRLVGTTLGASDGAFLVDESGIVKQGRESVGVAPQYCGSVGKVANSQVGVYLGYASAKGYTLIDSQLFIPEAWFADDHAEQRARTGVPSTLTFQSKPAIALALLQQAVARGSIPATWVVADALYGNSPSFRDGVANFDLCYFTAVSSDTLVWRRHPAVVLPPYRGRGRTPTRLQLKTATHQPYRIDTLPQRLPAAAWMRMTITEGSQGPLIADVAVIRVTEARDGLPGPRLWLVIRRSLSDPRDVRYYLSNAPETTPLATVVRMLGVRWPIELTFEHGKQAVGMDAYEVRSWQGWHHHMTLVMLAHHFLVWVRVQWQARAPGLTLPQVQLLLISVLPQPVFDAARALEQVRYYQRRNHAAYRSHTKRHTKRRELLAEHEAERRLRYPGRPPNRPRPVAAP